MTKRKEELVKENEQLKKEREELYTKITNLESEVKKLNEELDKPVIFTEFREALQIAGETDPVELAKKKGIGAAEAIVMSSKK